MRSDKKVVILDGMGGPLYPLNCCEIVVVFDNKGIKCESCTILWGHPSCEGCPRDKVVRKWFGEPNPQAQN